MWNTPSIPREFYIPKGAVKITDKASDAVAYLYRTPKDQPAYCVFYGKQSKPVARYRALNEAQRIKAVQQLFDSRQASLRAKADRRAERNAKPRKVELGAAYYTMWGYDQTNVDWYEVVELVGEKSARVRRIRSQDASNGDEPYMTGKAIPAMGQYIGEPQLVRCHGDSFKIDGHYASRWELRAIGWTAYA